MCQTIAPRGLKRIRHINVAVIAKAGGHGQRMQRLKFALGVDRRDRERPPDAVRDAADDAFVAGPHIGDMFSAKRHTVVRFGIPDIAKIGIESRR